MRATCNRVIVSAVLVVLLPAVVVGERLRPGLGRRIAVRGIRLLMAACGVRVEVQGAHHIPAEGPWVIAANHSSAADIPAILLACPDAEFLAAAEVFDKPLLGSAMRALGCLPIDRSDTRNAIRQLSAIPATRPDVRLAMFPEGGIAAPGTRRPFKSGALSLAPRLGAPVIPVAIAGAEDVLPPRSGFAVRPGRITVTVGPAMTFHHAVHRHEVRDRVEAAVLAALGAGAASLRCA